MNIPGRILFRRFDHETYLLDILQRRYLDTRLPIFGKAFLNTYLLDENTSAVITFTQFSQSSHFNEEFTIFVN